MFASLTPVSGWQAEWLYSQSKGRQFSVGEQSKLVEFLMATCPLDPDQETDQDRKLNLILSKVQVSNDFFKNISSKWALVHVFIVSDCGQ